MFCLQSINFRVQTSVEARSSTPAAETFRSSETFPVYLDVSSSSVTPARWPVAQKPVTCRASAGSYKRNSDLRRSFPKKGTCKGGSFEGRAEAREVLKRISEGVLIVGLYPTDTGSQLDEYHHSPVKIVECRLCWRWGGFEGRHLW